MAKLFETADIVVSRWKWQDMALLKFCLAALGIMIGMSIPNRNKKFFWILAPVVFAVTYVPLMLKLAGILKGCKKGD